MSEFDITPPQVNRISHTYSDLVNLPEPKGRIKVSVYQFRDQTGQFKPQTNVSSFSTAVTQGAANMLIQALETSHWFVPVEREGLQNLLTERKIISAGERNGGDKENLPPLDSATVMLMGGITSYETNLITGGFGAKYWGLGGSTQYRQDQVTVHLRAVDVRTGRVMKSVSTSKTVLSYEVDAGLFRFLTFKKLLEIEAGFSHNEPVQMCVAAAIEKAVIALIIDGIQDNLWVLKNPADINSPVITGYLDEVSMVNAKADKEAMTAKATVASKSASSDMNMSASSGTNISAGGGTDMNASSGTGMSTGSDSNTSSVTSMSTNSETSASSLSSMSASSQPSAASDSSSAGGSSSASDSSSAGGSSSAGDSSAASQSSASSE